jgi:hypothetical protein
MHLFMRAQLYFRMINITAEITKRDSFGAFLHIRVARTFVMKKAWVYPLDSR